MNCPTCGAKNETDARFCAECGAPLEEEDDDRTIMSTVSEISEEAKTVAVTQDDVAELAAEMEAEKAETEADSSSPPASPPAGGNGDDGFMNQRNIIIAVAVLLVLCLCCIIIVAITLFATGEIDISLLKPDLLPNVLSFV